MIQRVRFKPLGKSCFSILLCCLRILPLVRPINDVDVSHLENEFVMGYRDGDRAMYVSAYNNLDEPLDVSDDIKSSWSPGRSLSFFRNIRELKYRVYLIQRGEVLYNV